MTPHPVTFNQLLEALKYQGLSLDDISPGDVILIRFGYIKEYEKLKDDKRAQLDELYKRQKPENIGIEPSKEFLKFLWDKKISAVAGDTRSFEVWPCTQTDWHLHEWLLAGWGMPIGELFDLEKLSKVCHESRRYTFFFTSSPMNVRFSSPFQYISMDEADTDHNNNNRPREPSQALPMRSHFSRIVPIETI